MQTVFFTQRVEVMESYQERRDCADQRIARFLYACGFLPLPVPNTPEIVVRMMEDVIPSGVVLTGGNSLVSYGGNAPERDKTEHLLLELAEQKNIPVYGFCRGMQMVLDHFGIRLTPVEGHVAVKHEIIGSFGTRMVNSYHAFACTDATADGMEVLAVSSDGVVEAARISGKKVLGTMWHPERCDPFEERDMRMIKLFFEEDRAVL